MSFIFKCGEVKRRMYAPTATVKVVAK